jgi:MAF protein
MIILASQSPRRVELLRLLGWDFEVRPAAIDETLRPGEPADAYVLRLAEAKARAILGSAPPDSILIGADTAVADRGQVLGKPFSTDKALRILQQLRGRTHQVYTGVAVLQASDGKLFTDLCTTDVPMRAYSDDEIRKYVGSGDPMDKAGAYAIQNHEFNPVDGLAGCFANVMGLPLCHLTRTLRKLEISPRTDLPARCQEELGYDCPVFEEILVR